MIKGISIFFMAMTMLMAVTAIKLDTWTPVPYVGIAKYSELEGVTKIKQWLPSYGDCTYYDWYGLPIIWGDYQSYSIDKNYMHITLKEDAQSIFVGVVATDNTFCDIATKYTKDKGWLSLSKQRVYFWRTIHLEP